MQLYVLCLEDRIVVSSEPDFDESYSDVYGGYMKAEYIYDDDASITAFLLNEYKDNLGHLGNPTIDSITIFRHSNTISVLPDGTLNKNDLRYTVYPTIMMPCDEDNREHEYEMVEVVDKNNNSKLCPITDDNTDMNGCIMNLMNNGYLPRYCNVSVCGFDQYAVVDNGQLVTPIKFI